MNSDVPERVIGEEARKSHAARRASGFLDRYLSGEHILDIGYKGYVPDVLPIVPQAIGVELDYPGYDGRTLPFPDASQDAVFASHCLEHIPDFRNALRDWHRVLKVGGFIVVMVPHQFLYEKRVAMPSLWNADHQRFYTPASLMTDVESALLPNTYRLRHLVDNDAGFEYRLDPAQHSGGSYELELVLEKIAAPAWPLETNETEPAEPPPDITPTELVIAQRSAQAQRIRLLPADFCDLAVYDCSAGRQDGVRRILALKLDHFGDFIIGMPAMEELRETFPEAHIRLVCGSWNVAMARASGLFDDIRSYDYFPENALGWDGTPVQPPSAFQAASAGRWDLAVDLRVDDDTRALLEAVDTDVRCGIGTRTRQPFLDVILPPEHEDRQNPLSERMPDMVLRPDLFHSLMTTKSVFYHETAFAESNRHLIYGPYIQLPRGRLRVTVGLQLDGWTIGMGRLGLTFDILRDQTDIVAAQPISAKGLVGRSIQHISVEFDNRVEDARYEFRVHAHSRPLRGKLRFFGVQVEHLETAPAPRFRRAELHIGEQLSLLVRLLGERTRPLYGNATEAAVSPHDNRLVPEAAPGVSDVPGRLRIVVAPVGNSDLRNWPLSRYAALVRLLVARLDCTVILTGSRGQTGELAMIAQQSGGSERVLNMAGRTAWAELPGLLRQADLVICNNSGVAHLAAAEGVRTLAIYSASHQPQEWGPRGARARAVMAVVACSPCGHDRLSECRNDHACMRLITPEAVAELAVSFLAEPEGTIAAERRLPESLAR